MIEDYSSGVLYPRRIYLLKIKPFFHVVSCDEIALRKILLLGEIQG
jgi:hypothetical protein